MRTFVFSGVTQFSLSILDEFNFKKKLNLLLIWKKSKNRKNSNELFIDKMTNYSEPD